MEQEAPFILRGCSCRSLVERLCIARVLKVPPFILKARLCNLPSLQNFLNIYDLPLFPCVFGILFESKKTSKPYAPKTPQILKKPTSTPPKIDAKTTQNRTQDAPKSTFGRGPQKTRFRNPKFSAPGERFGASWSRPGNALGASWGCLGAV